ncbi:hypothetical protein G6F62_005256 [Rhizopus arrhizus]|nr:hypothetical protein G6F62_005256 [Rhizopus arrhizus]KAG1377404.1 hypothetical protein G6F61_006769 [Rhizopus arrhizus]KAG1405992.1 hypothetical protein G6F60_003238 [Rhizopus arrhizus]
MPTTSRSCRKTFATTLGKLGFPLRSRLCKLDINNNHILDTHYPDRNVVALLIHNDYEDELRSQLKRFKISLKDDFDLCDPKTLRDPKYVEFTDEERTNLAFMHYCSRMERALRSIRVPVKFAVARHFFNKGWVSKQTLKETLSSSRRASHAEADPLFFEDELMSTMDDCNNTQSNFMESHMEGDPSANMATSDTTHDVLKWSTMVDDHELKFHYLAHKKSAGSMFNDIEKKYLEDFTGDGSPRSDLLVVSAELLLKEKLSSNEDSLLALSLSGIYNYFNPFMKEVYIKKLNRESPLVTEQDSTNIANAFIDNEIETKLNEVFSKKDDIDEMLAFIQDVLFGASEIKMADGETACHSSRVCTETNKRLFNVDDPTPAYSRKIDLLLKYDENISVELCSNEWKKVKVSYDLKIKQQSKNLRVNAATLNKLQSSFGLYFSNILAMDIIGLKGYIYKLCKEFLYKFTSSTKKKNTRTGNRSETWYLLVTRFLVKALSCFKSFFRTVDSLQLDINWIDINVSLVAELPLTRICPSLVGLPRNQRLNQASAILVRHAYTYEHSTGSLRRWTIQGRMPFHNSLLRYFDLLRAGILTEVEEFDQFKRSRPASEAASDLIYFEASPPNYQALISPLLPD